MRIHASSSRSRRISRAEADAEGASPFPVSPHAQNHIRTVVRWEIYSRLLYINLPIRWKRARDCSRLPTASSMVLPDFFFVPVRFGMSTREANWRAMMALLISPCADSTIMSRTSLDGAQGRVGTSAMRALRRRVGAIGLNLCACVCRCIVGG